MLKELRRIEILKSDEPPAVWWIAIDHVADEPAGKHRRLNPGGRPPGIARVDGRCSEFGGIIDRNPPVARKTLMEKPGKALLLDHRKSALPEHLPVIEALYEN
jgi:hypothetical protein